MVRLEGDERAVGFDCEWVFSRVANLDRPVSLVQVATAKDCFLFRLTTEDEGGALPPALRALLEDEEVFKAGVGVRGDFTRLAKDYGTRPRGAAELRALARKRLPPGLRARSWTLCALLEHLVGRTLCKGDGGPRESNWESVVLSGAQVRYAAADAWAGLLAYRRLLALPSPDDAAAAWNARVLRGAAPGPGFVPAAGLLEPLRGARADAYRASCVGRAGPPATGESRRALAAALAAGYPYREADLGLAPAALVAVSAAMDRLRPGLPRGASALANYPAAEVRALAAAPLADGEAELAVTHLLRVS